jgi:hypothetical protein
MQTPKISLYLKFAVTAIAEDSEKESKLRAKLIVGI